jgi:hypothetical protein
MCGMGTLEAVMVVERGESLCEEEDDQFIYVNLADL